MIRACRICSQCASARTIQCEKCGEIGKWHRLSKMPAYTCNCGNHIHPMAGTPFLRTRTSLQKWFYAMFLFTTTRNGVAAKELQRQLGVTYKTAWRMAHEIRIYMGWVDGDAPLGGPGTSRSLKPTRLSSAVMTRLAKTTRQSCSAWSSAAAKSLRALSRIAALRPSFPSSRNSCGPAARIATDDGLRLPRPCRARAIATLWSTTSRRNTFAPTSTPTPSKPSGPS